MKELPYSHRERATRVPDNLSRTQMPAEQARLSGIADVCFNNDLTFTHHRRRRECFVISYEPLISAGDENTLRVFLTRRMLTKRAQIPPSRLSPRARGNARVDQTLQFPSSGLRVLGLSHANRTVIVHARRQIRLEELIRNLLSSGAPGKRQNYRLIERACENNHSLEILITR